MGGMPYMVEKGPVWQSFDRWFGRSNLQQRLQRKLDVLVSLQQNGRFTDFVPAGTTMPPAQVQLLKQHINDDWFGLPKLPGGGWGPPNPPNTSPSGPGTGKWVNWWGDAETIAREAVIRAIEVSLGLHHHDWTPANPVTLADYGISASAPPARDWPIEFWWICPLPTFQASLTWRHDHANNNRGLVAVTWLTPSNGDELFHELDHTPRTQPNPGQYIGWAVDPADAPSRFGSWLIGQGDNDTVHPPSWSPTPSGTWPSTVDGVWSYGEIVTVSPELLDGGVDPQANY